LQRIEAFSGINILAKQISFWVIKEWRR